MSTPNIKSEHPEAWFWSQLDRTGEHWLWTGRTDTFGYGRLTWEGREEKAHRVAYTLVYGPIEPGVVIRHGCDIPACCKPTCLSKGTHLDNMRDAVERDRIASGERSGRAKLTAALVEAIRTRYANEPMTGIRQLAREYGVSQPAMKELLKGMTWKKAGGPIAQEAKVIPWHRP